MKYLHRKYKVMGNIINPYILSPKIPTDYVLAYDFDGNLIDKSTNANNGGSLGTVSFGNVTDSSGKTVSCVTFNTGLIHSIFPLAISTTNKISLAFGIKTNQTGTQIFLEASSNFSISNGFAAVINENTTGGIELYDADIPGSYSRKQTGAGVNICDNRWHFIVISDDRSLSVANETKFYIDNNLVSTTVGRSYECTLNFANQILNIGARDGLGYSFIGSMAKLKFYNRILTVSEIKSLNDDWNV